MLSRPVLLKKVRKTHIEEPEEIVNALCDALSISGRSEAESATLRKIAESTAAGKGLTSKALSKELKIPRSTVIYRLNYFINAGLVIRRGRQYFMRGASLEETLEELQAETLAEFNRLMKLASKFDEMMESEIYGRRE
ncbi:MAG: helix-turn-helix domain-containing protein [Candidatus Micrarchaeaceae archaeon]